MTVRRKHIRQLADKLLKENAVRSSPVPVESIATKLGTLVQRAPAADDLSGFIYRDHRSKATVIGVNESHHPHRQSFTIAHELGHFLLHDMQDVHVDRGFSVKLRNQKSSEGVDIEEKEANLFAAELLMPKNLLEQSLQVIPPVDLVDEGVIAELAEQYGVSTQAMTFRLAYLGYIHL
jgi:Zn-dependent peptidase ImmA (M78 family)